MQITPCSIIILSPVCYLECQGDRSSKGPQPTLPARELVTDDSLVTGKWSNVKLSTYVQYDERLKNWQTILWHRCSRTNSFLQNRSITTITSANDNNILTNFVFEFGPFFSNDNVTLTLLRLFHYSKKQHRKAKRRCFAPTDEDEWVKIDSKMNWLHFLYSKIAQVIHRFW